MISIINIILIKIITSDLFEIIFRVDTGYKNSDFKKFD